jgi:predicted ArsR family transcriptional regulator
MLKEKDSQTRLLNLIKKQGEITLKQAVEMTELSKTTIREHLTILEKDGYIERYAKREGRGRPELYFHLTQKGHKLFPSHDSKILRDLLRFLKRNEHQDLINAFFEQFWNNRLEEVQFRLNRSDDDSLKTTLSILQDILEEQGFMPEITIENERIQVNECNCPFSETIKETKLPCKLEAIFFKKLLNAELNRVRYIPDGNYSCSYELNPIK